MCPEDSRAAFRWLDHGQAAALLSLRAGDPAHFTGQSDTVQIQLTARPVLPLPRAPLTAPCEHRAPTP